MAYQLKLDEMLDALCNSGHPQALQFTQLVEATADILSSALCQQLDIECEAATFQGAAFAGTCAPFRARHAGQALPDEIAHYDDPAEWEAPCPDCKGLGAFVDTGFHCSACLGGGTITPKEK
jgi:hypothetical protein